MTARYVVVDGSNIATEGRSIPSLVQLDEAVRAFMAERPDEQVIVVVDASFGYRIDESERREFEQAEAAGEIVSPPAGAIGRGDGFLLRIADRTDATVLSNDSFQEFHGEYPWLFDTGRLIGGKPVPGVGWIFTLRTPVRGPRSREATRAADKAKKAALKRAKVADGAVAEAIAEATAEVIAPKEDGEEPEPATKVLRRVRRRRSKPAGTVNDPLPFIEFIAEHPLGTEVEGEVDSFTSHGAFVRAGSARCYVPLVALGDPPPRSAKEVLTRGEIRTFVVQALDPPRRGIELALPGLARVAGAPTEETVEADIGVGRRKRKDAKAAAKRPAAVAAAGQPAVEPVPSEAVAEPVPGAKRARKSRKKAAAEPVEAPVAVAEPAEAEREAAPAEAAPAAKARKTRKKAAPEPLEPVPEAAVPAPAKAGKTRKKAMAAAEDVPVAEPVPAVPAKARRTRKKAMAAPEPEAVSAAPEPEAVSAVSEAGEPSAPTRARRRARPADAEPAVSEGAPGPDSAVARPRRRRAAATDAGAEAPSAESAEEAAPDDIAEAAAPTGPRRSPTRAAARLAAPRMTAPETESEQAPPIKRSRARKAAASDAAPRKKVAKKAADGDPEHARPSRGRKTST